MDGTHPSPGSLSLRTEWGVRGEEKEEESRSGLIDPIPVKGII